jgi:hypothetical protein
MTSNKHLLIFLRAFINELLGRYLGLYQFVDRSRREAGGQATSLVDEYYYQLDQSVSRLLAFLPTLYDLPVPDEQVDKQYLCGVFGSLRFESEEFQKTHRTLRWFSEPWPDAELFQFIKNVFKERGLQEQFDELNPSIVFHDVYNFLTYDIGYMQHSVNRADLDAWALPKSESSNPLLWTVLVHEVAHDIYDDSLIHDYLGEQLRSFPKSPEKIELLDTLSLWSRELNADLFSFHVLGPAYLYSLIYFSVFFVKNDLRTPFLTESKSPEVWSRPTRDSRNLHPPPKDRISLLIDEMSSMNLTQSPEHAHCLEVFKALFYARCEFDNAEDFYEPREYESIELNDEVKRNLWKSLKELQLEFFPKEYVLGERDIQDSISLYKRLKKRELACALPRPERDLNKLLQYVQRNEQNVSRSVALHQLDEKPARMIDIINAGWMNKADDPYWLKPVCSIEQLADASTEWPQILDPLSEPARQLQKSIQVALIILPLLQEQPQSPSYETE